MIYDTDYFDCLRCNGRGCDICGGTGKSNIRVHPLTESKELGQYKAHLRSKFEAHRLKHTKGDNFSKAQVVQDLLEDCGLYFCPTESENICHHIMDFDPLFRGYCPQPKICVKCGKKDNNGFNGNRL